MCSFGGLRDFADFKLAEGLGAYDITRSAIQRSADLRQNGGRHGQVLIHHGQCGRTDPGRLAHFRLRHLAVDQ